MGFAVRGLLLCAIAAATLGANRNESDVVRTLERMRGAAGPVWQAHLISVSRLEFNGAPTVASTDSQGLRIAVRRCNGELCDGTYFDGSRLFSINLNGTALPQSSLPEPYLRAVRLVSSLGFLDPSFIARGGRVGGAGSATIGGKPYRTFVVADAGSVPMRIYVDESTGLVGFARDLDGRESFEYRDYRRVGAFTLPFTVVHDGQPFERYDERAPVSIAFVPPHGPLPAFAGAPAPVPTDPKSITPIVDCSVGGIASRCLLDTGNSGLSMSSELASRLGAPVVGAYQVRGLGGYSTQVVRAGPLRIGNATYPAAYYVVLNDLRQYGYDVVLGADVLGTTTVSIDGAAHQIRFGAPLERSAISLPLSFQYFVPIVNLRLGTLDARLAVDTGDESNINLAYDFYTKHPGLFSATQRRFVSGIGGNSVEMIGEIGQVTIGGYRTGPQRIGATQMLGGTAFGHLGAAFLQQFVVQFDYAGAQLRLTPRRS